MTENGRESSRNGFEKGRHVLGFFHQVDGQLGCSVRDGLYRWIPDHGPGPKGMGPAKSRCQHEDLELVPRDVERVDHLYLHLRWDRYDLRLPGGCFGYVRAGAEFFWHWH